ncbi:MAG: hypothetical protein WCG10_05410 [Chlamydiota bacterium]
MTIRSFSPPLYINNRLPPKQITKASNSNQPKIPSLLQEILVKNAKPHLILSESEQHLFNQQKDLVEPLVKESFKKTIISKALTTMPSFTLTSQRKALLESLAEEHAENLAKNPINESRKLLSENIRIALKTEDLFIKLHKATRLY